MKLVQLHVKYYNINKFYLILMKNKKYLYITHLLDGPSIKGRWIEPKAEVSEWLTSVQKEWLVFVCLYVCKEAKHASIVG